MALREARIEDAEELARLAGELGYPCGVAVMEERLRASRPEEEAWLVAEGADGRPLGLLHVARFRCPMQGTYARVGALVVDARHRGAGLGRALLGRAERWARARGLARIGLESRTTRERAHAFYRGLGYRDVKAQLVFEKDLE